MKIGIDVRCLTEGRRTGVEEYVLNLLPELFRLDRKDEFVLFLNSFKKIPDDFSWALKYKNVKVRRLGFPNKLLNFFFWYFGWPKIDRLLGGVEVMFFPNISFGAVSRRAKTILTVHDLSFERYPEFFSRKRRLWHIFLDPRKISKKADRVITVSKSSEVDLRRLYGISEGKIRVIPSGISEKFQIADRNDPELIRVKEKYSLPWNFILYFGTFEPRKNIIALIRAFGRLKQEGREEKCQEIERYKLVLSGSSGWLEEGIREEIEKNGLSEEVITTSFVDEKDKGFLYNLAGCLVFPSFLEGFGFPPLEAQRSGVPVVVSNNSSFPETAGSGAIMIDPERPDDIARALKSLVLDKDFRNSFSEKGLSNAGKFTWRKSAEGVLGLLDELRSEIEK